jgi:RNA polymerase-binding transcription factor DksA
MTMEELQEHFDQKIAEASGKSPAASDTLEGNMSPDSLQQSGEHQAEASSSSIGLAEATDEVDEYRLCPKCGSTIFRRSHRRWYERLLRRPRMARCMKCDRRFPYPH